MLTFKSSFQMAQFGKSFRKTLVTDFKLGNKHTHKNPHAIPLKTKDALMKVLRL